MDRLVAGIELTVAGERAAAAAHLSRLWAETPEDDWLQRCGVAHALADVQDDPQRELEWDLLALEAAAHLDADVRATFLPSLHLNAGESFRKAGDARSSRRHLERGRAALSALGHDPYGGMLTDAFERLAQRLAGLTA
jgi:hypothetical protein